MFKNGVENPFFNNKIPKPAKRFIAADIPALRPK